MNWPSSHVLQAGEEDGVQAAGSERRRPLGLPFAASAKEMQVWKVKEWEEVWVQKSVTYPDVTEHTMANLCTNSVRAAGTSEHVNSTWTEKRRCHCSAVGSRHSPEADYEIHSNVSQAFFVIRKRQVVLHLGSLRSSSSGTTSFIWLCRYLAHQSQMDVVELDLFSKNISRLDVSAATRQQRNQLLTLWTHDKTCSGNDWMHDQPSNAHLSFSGGGSMEHSVVYRSQMNFQWPFQRVE
ncbi:hypothetical protein MG293_020307 [Ovis ammon polii]|uniref:Uncharacterized protein n=1 Tax=Ovis ammon polii TaxID=230172 RepID=A0AAD4XZM4_OVIAM|nr:hypothetical protein MG293_020307 [Ovis ammon polii]